jgi:hypothetical protein
LIPVEGGDNNHILFAIIIRTTGFDGKRKDEVTLSADNVNEIVKKLSAAGIDTARIVIPDTKDEVAQVNVNLPAGAARQLVEGRINLEVRTANAGLLIPYASLAGITEDIYFHIVPIKNQVEQDQIKERSLKEEAVKAVLGNGGLQVISRPMTIETNLSSRSVSLLLPLPAALIPANAKERQQWLNNLAIFIEHSDGERVVIKPELAIDAAGQLSLKFTVTKFSTFTILHISNWSLYQQQRQSTYINGYADGSFKPEKSVSRAEIAAMLSRIGAGEQGAVATVSFSDMPADHWAFQVVALIQSTGLMKGLADDTFMPNVELTRAEMAVIISRWLKLTNEGDGAASDIQGHWAERSIRLVIQAGMMSGIPDGSFKPDQALTRAEAVAIFNRVLGREPLPASSVPTWTDVPSSHWAFGHIEQASRNHS